MDADIKNQNNNGQDNTANRPNIKELEEKIAELENNWKRALADYKNLEKRVAEEREALISFSNMVLISELLPVLDNLELLNNHLKDQGLELTIKSFKQVFENEHVHEIEALEKDFDPGVMEAVELVEGDEGKVIEVVQKGYHLKDKLIRPARVKVGRFKED
ncbi:MAG TPA: nucleotide exchange factor GrpE [Patescibacteria group bacterium]|nr:nucleotide exchange factor GrpE [Patescibacteria group bacterium]